jgi:hypothetical protein
MGGAGKQEFSIDEGGRGLGFGGGKIFFGLKKVGKD